MHHSLASHSSKKRKRPLSDLGRGPEKAIREIRREARKRVAPYPCISIVTCRNFSGFYRRLLCSVMSCPLRIRLRASQENDNILPKFPAAVLAELLGRHARGQNKRPAGRAVSPCGSRGLSPQIVLQPVIAPDVATGIGLSIYFRFFPFIAIAG